MEKILRDERFFFAEANTRVASLFKRLRNRFPKLFQGGRKNGESTFGKHYYKVISANEEQRLRERLNISAGDPAKLKSMKSLTVYEYFFIVNEMVLNAKPKKPKNGQGRNKLH